MSLLWMASDFKYYRETNSFRVSTAQYTEAVKISHKNCIISNCQKKGKKVTAYSLGEQSQYSRHNRHFTTVNWAWMCLCVLLNSKELKHVKLAAGMKHLFERTQTALHCCFFFSLFEYGSSRERLNMQRDWTKNQRNCLRQCP